MIDSTDRERLEKAVEEFELLLQEEDLMDASLCLLANKQVFSKHKMFFFLRIFSENIEASIVKLMKSRRLKKLCISLCINIYMRDICRYKKYTKL